MVAKKRNSAIQVDFAETAVIPISQTTSGAIDTVGMSLIGVTTSAALTGTTFTFLASDTAAGTFNPIFNDVGGQVTVTIAVDRVILWNTNDLAGIRFLKLVSNATETAERTIKLIIRQL